MESLSRFCRMVEASVRSRGHTQIAEFYSVERRCAMKTRINDPPQVILRDTLSQLVQRLEQAIKLAKQRDDPALVGQLQAALELAVKLLDQTLCPATKNRAKVLLLVASVEAIKLILDDLIAKLVELGLHSIF